MKKHLLLVGACVWMMLSAHAQNFGSCGISNRQKIMGRGTARRKLIDGSDGLWRNIARRIAVERRNALGRRTVSE